jgi:hypothetical protein
MALYNNMTVADAKGIASSMADDMERAMARWKYFADVWATISEAEMTALGMSTDYYSQITSLKADILALEAWYRANCLFVKRFCHAQIF